MSIDLLSDLWTESIWSQRPKTAPRYDSLASTPTTTASYASLSYSGTHTPLLDLSGDWEYHNNYSYQRSLSLPQLLLPQHLPQAHLPGSLLPVLPQVSPVLSGTQTQALMQTRMQTHMHSPHTQRHSPPLLQTHILPLQATQLPLQATQLPLQATQLPLQHSQLPPQHIQLQATQLPQPALQHSRGSTQKPPINTQLYKTEMCGLFVRTKCCPYGSKCQFAHGEHELKQVERPSNWRSKPCVNWSRRGHCRYGSRCCFKHSV